MNEDCGAEVPINILVEVILLLILTFVVNLVVYSVEVAEEYQILDKLFNTHQVNQISTDGVPNLKAFQVLYLIHSEHDVKIGTENQSPN